MIKFNEEEHTYTNTETGELYTSATTVIGKFKKKFDELSKSKEKAEREGVTQEEILEKWHRVRDQACEYGTYVHKVMENWLLSEKIKDEDYELYVKPLEQIWYPEKNKIEPEKRLWNHEFKIAGTTDVYENNGKYFNLYDFKTNKKFGFTNPYGDYMLKPLTHLPACEYSGYALQLSLYAYMESALSNKKVGELACFYYDRFEMTWSKINTPYLKLEIETMLNNFKDGNYEI